jgi:hypothetical protein
VGIPISGINLGRETNSLCEDEWNHMAQMHTVAAWSAAGVQKERFALLVTIKDFVEFPDLKGQHGATHHGVCSLTGARRTYLFSETDAVYVPSLVQTFPAMRHRLV